MFHIEFRQPQPHSTKTVPEVVDQVMLSEHIKGIQGKCEELETDVDQALKLPKDSPLDIKQEARNILSIPEPFTYERDGKLQVFLCKSDNYKMKCPNCQIETRYIVKHLARYKNCQKFIIIEDFKKQFTMYKSIKYKDQMRWVLKPGFNQPY